MTRLWTRLLMGLVFVFTTLTASMHAQAMATVSPAHAAAPVAETASTSGMSDACAKAMAAQATKGTAKGEAHGQMSGGCCSNGCNCPLSHCPATPATLVANIPALFERERSLLAGYSAHGLPSYLADTLKRPPKA